MADLILYDWWTAKKETRNSFHPSFIIKRSSCFAMILNSWVMTTFHCEHPWGIASKRPRVRKRDRTLTEDEGEREKHEKEKTYDFSPFHPFTTSCWNWSDVDEAKKAPGVTVKLREPREMEEKCIFFRWWRRRWSALRASNQKFPYEFELWAALFFMSKKC